METPIYRHRWIARAKAIQAVERLRHSRHSAGEYKLFAWEALEPFAYFSQTTKAFVNLKS
jgi:hypothetical protein